MTSHPITVKAGIIEAGSPIRCGSCLETKDKGRAYDLCVALFDETGSPRMHGVLTLCESCRSAFDAADFELTAEDQERDFMARQDELRATIEEADNLSRKLWNPRPKHLTFPRAMGGKS